MEKQPPHSAELELALLSSLITDHTVLIEIADHVTPETFYKHENRAIYSEIISLNALGRPYDIITLSQEFIKEDKAKLIDNAIVYISLLSENYVPKHTALDYAKVLRGHEISRDLIKHANKVLSYSYDDPAKALDIAQNELQHIQTKVTGSKTKDWNQIMQDTTADLQERNQKFLKGETTGVTIGSNMLDNVLVGGWQPSDLVLFGGRPAMGKTAMALRFIKAALDCGNRVKVYSLEMSSQQLTHRLIGTNDVNPKKMRKGDLNEFDWQKIDEFASDTKNWDLLINDEAGITIGNLEVDAYKDHIIKPIDLLFIDYLQLIDNPNGNSLNEKIGEISKRLKRLAKKLNVPIVALSQLSRDNAKNGTPPNLTDLRDSGSLEQDADSVLFIHRNYYYTQDPNDMNLGDIIVAKNRHGDSNLKVGFRHNEFFTKFSDIDEVNFEEIKQPVQGSFKIDGLTPMADVMDDKPF